MAARVVVVAGAAVVVVVVVGAIVVVVVGAAVVVVVGATVVVVVSGGNVVVVVVVVVGARVVVVGARVVVVVVVVVVVGAIVVVVGTMVTAMLHESMPGFSNTGTDPDPVAVEEALIDTVAVHVPPPDGLVPPPEINAVRPEDGEPRAANASEEELKLTVTLPDDPCAMLVPGQDVIVAPASVAIASVMPTAVSRTKNAITSG